MVRIEEVASRAGVSTATVSRALRGLPNVSSKTRELVLRAAAELDYVPSSSASNLASGRTRSVAVLTPYIGRWYFAEVIAALEHALRPAGYDVLLHTLTVTPRAPFDLRNLRGRVDAVVVLTVPLTGAELDVLRGLGLPLVFIGAAIPGASCVRIDDVAVGRMATHHLLTLGHRRIAHLGGDPNEPLNFPSPSDRRAGWMWALQDAGIEPRRDYHVNGYFTPQGGAEGMRRLLGLREPPSAVFAASDEMALGAAAAARAAGVQVPDDLSLIGVDDHPLAEVEGLTTVAQGVTEQARSAARVVLALLDADDPPPPEHLLVPVHVVHRGSCAAGPRTQGWAERGIA